MQVTWFELQRRRTGTTPGRLGAGGDVGGKDVGRACARPARRAATAVAVAISAIALAACGSSSSASSSSSGGSSSHSAGSGGSANLAAAQAAISPYTGHPSAFPVDQPLPKPLAPGTHWVYLQCTAPTCALIGKLFAPAVKAIGGTMSTINMGATASSAQAAASSALAEHPNVVLLPAITPSVFGDSIKRMDAAHIKVASGWIMHPQPYGVGVSVGDYRNASQAGRLMADWVIAHKGAKADVALYTTPELGFSPPMTAGFEQEMAKNCPSCKVRTVPISIATFGSTAPQTVVADLQSHPSTNTAVFVSLDAAAGLPAALKTAGLSVTTIGFSPSPEGFQDIKAGRLTEGLGFDLPVQMWTVTDAAARLLEGANIPTSESNVPLEFIGQQQVTFNPSNGWTGYPAFPQRFAKLWSK